MTPGNDIRLRSYVDISSEENGSAQTDGRTDGDGGVVWADGSVSIRIKASIG